MEGIGISHKGEGFALVDDPCVHNELLAGIGNIPEGLVAKGEGMAVFKERVVEDEMGHDHRPGEALGHAAVGQLQSIGSRGRVGGDEEFLGHAACVACVDRKNPMIVVPAKGTVYAVLCLHVNEHGGGRKAHGGTFKGEGLALVDDPRIHEVGGSCQGISRELVAEGEFGVGIPHRQRPAEHLLFTVVGQHQIVYPGDGVLGNLK